MNMHPRIARERRTIAVMVSLHCRHTHASREMCPQCRSLLDYAFLRLDKCPFQHNKPTCAKCPVHCYQPERRAQMRAVMRYSGPRMIYRHPLLALFHLRDGLRKAPPQKA
ncbi:MAG: nitrous oxide-stimulated promoter family protein [Dehalococcoidales bacterium]|nr:nitrous oxide-stimulated promoter family protein [Dehalococcoidales bacterium]